MNPESAAHWIAQRVLEDGRLPQSEAVRHLMEYRDPRLAYHTDFEQACVGRPVRRRLRRRYPGLKYDRRLKSWRSAGD
jgi:hypothetical protein